MNKQTNISVEVAEWMGKVGRDFSGGQFTPRQVANKSGIEMGTPQWLAFLRGWVRGKDDAMNEQNPKTNLSAAIDALGDIRAKITELEKQEAEMRSELKAIGPGTHVSQRYSMTISEQSRDVLDMHAVKEHLGPEFVAEHTSVTKYLMFRFTKRAKIEEEEAEAS